MAFELAARRLAPSWSWWSIVHPSSVQSKLLSKSEGPSSPLFLTLAPSALSLHFPSALSFPLPSLSPYVPQRAFSSPPPLSLPSRRATSPVSPSRRRRGRCGVKTEADEEEAAASRRRRPTTASLFSRSLARAPSVPLAIPPLPNERGRDPGCRPRGCTESERVSQ